MNVLVTGSHGMIATALIPRLRARGDRVLRLVRTEPEGSDDVRWDPPAGTIDAAALEGVDAVVHLAGVGIGDKKWTEARKNEVLESRTIPTNLLARTLAALDTRPRVLVSSSAIGYYGDRGDDVLTESASPGDDFGARVCREWEEATAPAEEAGIRVVRTRTGLVLTARGGFLKRLLLPFKLGIGGRLGSGRQWMSWVTLDDDLDAILYLIDADSVSGPVNVTAPNPVTNAGFTKQLGNAVHRPTVIPTPMPALKVVYGDELVDTLLGSERVVPERLQQSGFTFSHPELDGALRAVLA
jgi:uncharacterized protein (TIGR01777 family)